MSDASGPAATPWESKARRRFRRRSSLTLKRAMMIGIGIALMAAGVVTVPTPIPIGFVLFVMGLYFLARGSKAVSRGVKWGRGRSPRLSRALNAVKPRFPPPMRRFIERSDPGPRL